MELYFIVFIILQFNSCTKNKGKLFVGGGQRSDVL
jgi:hypothetical protein